MTDPYLGQLEIFGFSFPPYQWAFAAGQTVSIQQNAALFSLIGTNFGGNGTTTFQLPNLAARQACSSGTGPGLTSRTIGEPFGDASVTVTTTEMPAHNHGMNTYLPAGDETVVPATNSGIGVPSTGDFAVYAPPPGTPAVFNPQFVQPAGAGQPHYNLQPYLGLNYSIALAGVFPSFN